jgi:hypothetical protein
MMRPAQRHRKLIADLAAKGSGSGEFQMMGIAWGLRADQARLPSNEQQVDLASLARRLLWEGETALHGASGALPGLSGGGFALQRVCSFLLYGIRRLKVGKSGARPLPAGWF